MEIGWEHRLLENSLLRRDFNSVGKKKKRFSLQRILVGSKIECKIHTECSSVLITCGVLEDGNLLKDSGLVIWWDKNPCFNAVLYFFCQEGRTEQEKKIKTEQTLESFIKEKSPREISFSVSDCDLFI